MRSIPTNLLGRNTIATIPNLLRHPVIAQYGMKRFTVDRWRGWKEHGKPAPKLVTINVSLGGIQPVYKTTLYHLLVSIQQNLGVDTTKDIESLKS